MAMPLTYAVPGAEVEKVLDVAHSATCKRDEKTRCDCGAVTVSADGQTTSYKWKPSSPKRRGFIVKTKYPGDESFSSDCVEYCLVKFEPGKPPEKCLPTQLNLIKVANEAALMALKNEANIQKANDGLLDDMKNPVVVDQTGRDKRKGMSSVEAAEFAKK
jgi:hypothetical protein